MKHEQDPIQGVISNSKILQPHPSRSCGDCCLCCKVMKVADLNPPKLANVWCQHCAPSSLLPCSVYSTRPESCRDFVCSWLAGIIPEPLKPNKTKCVLSTATVTISGKPIECLNVYVDPGYPDAWKRDPVRAYLNVLAKKLPNYPIVILVGEERIVIVNRRVYPGLNSTAPVPKELAENLSKIIQEP